ncbi:MAG: TPM domain-containing protein [Planctomycetes bacterium]|nr:TPM domain-containing protein [Planctomycetota bacterium]MBI3846053.1 TPM domain-containing protein [Planctomycetota bacterium]
MTDLTNADWEAAGHAASPAWLHVIAIGGPIALALIVLAFVVVAIVRRRRYSVRAILTPRAKAALVAAVAAAERRTVGEVLPVVLEQSDRHDEANLRAALGLAAVGITLLGPSLPAGQPLVWLAAEVGCGLLGWVLARCLPDLRRRFVSEKRATEMTHEQAVQEFHRHALHHTRDATGVLIFVSLFERRVVVLGDEGIAAKVSEDHWRGTADAILKGIRRGDLEGGLREGIERCGAVLAEHFPWREGDRDEIPNRVIIRPE